MRKATTASALLIAGIVALSGCSGGVKRENAQLKEQNTTLNNDLTACNESTSALQAKFNSTVIVATARVKDLGAQAAATKQAASAVQARYSEAARAFNALKAKSDQDARTFAEVTEQNNALKAEMDKAAADTAALREHANSQIAELSRQIAMLQAKQAQLATKPVAAPRPANRPTANVNGK